jgi:antitoxin component YwqK of YwqJK toxin-antitoxin module
MAKYPYGQVRYEGQFDAGVPVGRFTYYHDNGFRSAQMDFRGTTGVCMSEQYDEKGKLMARGRFGSDRERDSIWTTFAFDGTKLEEASYTAGKLHGSYTMFYPNGTVMERGTYEHGTKVGTWTRFRETAAKERVVNYAAGLLQGTWTEYDEDGRVAVVGTYHNDLRHGKWTYFERGTAVRTEVYRRGILEKPSK